MKILFRDDNPVYQNRIDYVLRFIEQHPLVKGKLIFTRDEKETVDLKLYYGMEQESAFYIPSQKAIFCRVLPAFEHFNLNAYATNLMQIYALEQKKKPEQAFIKGTNFQFDLIETIFFHISRMEEYFCKRSDLDKYERMASRNQILVRYQLHQLPVVDHLVFAFAKALGLDLKPARTVLKMTHDIDVIRKNNSLLGQLRTVAAAIIKLKDLQRAKRVWNDKSKNPFDTFDWLLLKDTQIEKEIYFLVGGDSKYDTPYDLNDPVTQKIIRLAKERGYEIGIHPSYHTWKNQDLMLAEKEKLEAVIGTSIRISRQHYLRFSFKDTPVILDQLKIEKDASLGYGDQIGFRCGTGFPYHLYDFKKEQAFRFLEEPLVFMESALLEESNFRAAQLEKLWTDFLNKNQEHTMISFNFHNSRFYDAALSGIPLKEFYQRTFNPQSHQVQL